MSKKQVVFKKINTNYELNFDSLNNNKVNFNIINKLHKLPIMHIEKNNIKNTKKNNLK